MNINRKDALNVLKKIKKSFAEAMKYSFSKRMFVTLFVTFSVILLVISFIVYDAVKNRITENMLSALSQNMIVTSKQIDYMNTLTNAMVYSISADNYLDTEYENLTLRQKINISDVIFKNYSRPDFFYSAYIYYNSDKVISSSDGVTSKANMSHPEIIGAVLRKSGGKQKADTVFQKIKENGGTVELMSRYKSFYSKDGAELGVVIVNINLNKMIKYIRRSIGDKCFVSAGNGMVIYNGLDKEFSALYKADYEKDGSLITKRAYVGRVNYVIIDYADNFSKWCYLVRAEEGGRLPGAYAALSVFVSGIILCYFLALVFTSKFHGTTAAMVDKYSDYMSFGNDNSHKNELTILDRAFEQLVNNNRELISLTSVAESAILQKVLLKQCCGYSLNNDEREVLEQFKKYHNFERHSSFVAFDVYFYDLAGNSHALFNHDDLFEKNDEYNIIVTASGDSNIIGMILFDGENAGIVYEAAKIIVSKLKGKGYCAYVGIGRKCSSIDEYRMSYRDAANALQYRNDADSGEILFMSDFENKNVSGYYYPHGLEAELISNVKSGNSVLAEQTVENIYKELLTLKIPVFGISDIFWQIISKIVQTLDNMGISYDEATGSTYYKNHKEFNELDNSADIFNYTKNLINDIAVNIGKLRNHGNEESVRKIKEYISENMDKPITLDMLSYVIKLSPVYLSTIFKSVTGIGIKEYITKVKLKEAERLLLHTGNTIADVSAALGYDNTRTFQRAFKSNYGISPSEYRKINKK